MTDAADNVVNPQHLGVVHQRYVRGCCCWCWWQRDAVAMQGQPDTPYTRCLFLCKKKSPPRREIYASGGGLLVTSVNAPHLFDKRTVLVRDECGDTDVVRSSAVTRDDQRSIPTIVFDE